MPWKEPRGTFWRVDEPQRTVGAVLVSSWRGRKPAIVFWSTWAKGPTHPRTQWYPPQRVCWADLAEFRAATSTPLLAVYATPIAPHRCSRLEMARARELLVALDTHLEAGGYVRARWTETFDPESAAATNQRLRSRARRANSA